MNGLVIWAYSECRSMMGVYSNIVKGVDFPVVIASYHHHTFKGYHSARTATGFSSDEFSEMEIHPIGESWSAGKKILDDHKGYAHLFAVYQGAPNFLRVMKEVKRRGDAFGCICESPCNMVSGLKGWLKQNVYLRHVLPRKVRFVTDNAKFFINLSGDDSTAARNMGWADHKIIPWGYFSPAIPDSHLIQRVDNSEFTILVTGIMTWHRAPDVVMKALALLSRWGVKYKAIFTQEGPLLNDLKCMARQQGLPVQFVGLLPMPDLIKLYESCSVYVAAGRREPWGMRLNDALQCGAPLVVSRGMGGVKLVDDYKCGAAFNNGDHVDLAYKLKRLAEDKPYYKTMALNSFEAARLISPEKKAAELVTIIKESFAK